MLDRREFLLTAAASAASAAAQSSDGLDGDSLYKDVVAYHQIGEHRTASEGDRKTSDWIADRLKASGCSVDHQTFTTRQFSPGECSVTIAGKKVRAFPLWPAVPTIRGGISAPVMSEKAPRAYLRNKIVVTRIPYENHGAMTAALKAKILDLASESPAAIIAITDGPTLDIVAFNMEAGNELWPVPVALVAPRDSFAVERATWVQLEMTGEIQARRKRRILSASWARAKASGL